MPGRFKMIKLPKSSHTRKILTISALQIAAVIIAVCSVIAYMSYSGLSKGRWAFFIFVCILALSYAISMPIIFLKKIPRTFPNWNWNIMLPIPSVILVVLLLAASIAISVHVDHGCLEYCGLVSFIAAIAFLLTLLFLVETLLLLRKALKDRDSRRESAIVNNMETQTETHTDSQTSTSQL
ncbi:uncharacterized protein LOC114517061 [Dendronephthya gigantea]|uniref:uncharacterized protein LOC114517061 n=1 Tax=Dendronephthya gigantea TaxID=151771 RepID=UPI00106AF6BF|nr:uncharacterized protein LOC114517061 [Dendronephthya gigantea]